MFGTDYKAGCPSCSAIADGFNGIAVHLANHDVMLTAVSRAPLAKLRAYKERMGWTFPWVSSNGSDFNADFNVWFSEAQQREGGVEYNYRREGPMPAATSEWTMQGSDNPAAVQAAASGIDGVVYHTYSAYSRGLDGVWGMYQWLDRAPTGRNETGVWWRRHDEYPV